MTNYSGTFGRQQKKKKITAKAIRREKGPFFLFYFNTKIICNAKIMMPFYINKYKKRKIELIMYFIWWLKLCSKDSVNMLWGGGRKGENSERVKQRAIDRNKNESFFHKNNDKCFLGLCLVLRGVCSHC